MDVLSGHRTRIWDLPTRLFHWLLAAAVLGALGTGLRGGDAMVWHLRCGQAVLALLLFRLIWGLTGGYWSRFAALSLRPRALIDHLRAARARQTLVGHSPLGAWSILGVLLLLSVQVGTGLVSNDDIAFSGPLSHLVSNDTVATATAFHKRWGKALMWTWVGLHLAAIAWYRLQGRPLVAAMVHGDQVSALPQPASRDDAWTRLWGAVLFAGCVGLSIWVFSWAPAF